VGCGYAVNAGSDTVSVFAVRGNSNRAKGLPRVSALAHALVQRPWHHGVHSSRASLFRRRSTTSSGNPLKFSLGSRVAIRTATDSANSRRATKPSACADARSNHYASSTTHNGGRSTATSADRLSTAKPIRNRSARGPANMPRCEVGAENGAPGHWSCGGIRLLTRWRTTMGSLCSPTWT
jgi:hypothetical protein